MAWKLLRYGANPYTIGPSLVLGFSMEKEGGESMKAVLGVSVACLFLSGVAATAFSSGDTLASVSTGGYRQGIDLAGKQVKEESPAPRGCPALANTETFESRGLGYVRSREFAWAVRSVVIGASRYSPKEIPASWMDDADKWIEPEAGNISLPKGEDACNPALLYLASMEYRSKPGRAEVKPVLPRYVRAATAEARVAAASERTGPFAKRASTVEFKIAVAERMGAGECSRFELESAKLLLERARNVAAASRSDRKGAEWLDQAERNADSLLASRQLAFRQGVRCTAVSE